MSLFAIYCPPPPHSPFKDGNCSHLHDPSVKSPAGSECGKCFLRDTPQVPNPCQINRLRIMLLNSTTQKNAIVQSKLWELLSDDPGRDLFQDTLSFIDNTFIGIHNSFELPFVVPNGVQKLSNMQKMDIALKMHQKSPFSQADDSSHQAHLDFTFSASSRPGVYPYLGQNCMFLQTRYFKINSGSSTVEEVPLQSVSTDDIVKCSEVVFDAKGSSDCNHSIWFDANIEQVAAKNNREAEKKAKANTLTAHLVHSTPFVFMDPIDKDGQELYHSIMKEMIERNGGPVSTKLRERFIQLNNYNRTLAWPKNKLPAESAATPKTIEGHVNSPYICQGGNVKAIWESFKANLACVVSDNETPEGGSRLQAFLRIKTGRRSISSTLPKLPNDIENMADFLADYSPHYSQ